MRRLRIVVLKSVLSGVVSVPQVQVPVQIHQRNFCAGLTHLICNSDKGCLQSVLHYQLLTCPWLCVLHSRKYLDKPTVTSFQVTPNDTIHNEMSTEPYNKEARGGVVVKALRYKPAGRGFDPRWCHWNFSVT